MGISEKRKYIILLLFIFIGSINCRKPVVVYHEPGPPPHAKAYGYRAKHVFWYYPAIEVYYSPNLKVYTVLKNGEWLTMDTSPISIEGVSYVIIESESEKPWLNHSYYKQKYQPGKGKGKWR